METSPTYRIVSQSGVVVADGLPRSAPAIQLHEGTPSKGDKLPKDLSPGESSAVRYPLVQGFSICRVTRTVEGIVPDSAYGPVEFVEPDPVTKKDKPKLSEMSVEEADEMIETAKARRSREKKPSVSEMASTAAKDAIEGTKVRRGWGKKASS